jgi:hypothetical protein
MELTPRANSSECVVLWFAHMAVRCHAWVYSVRQSSALVESSLAPNLRPRIQTPHRVI